jgi:2-keto-4-pentenoate hydratase/2-oxohepta-3-ene-1,7-dioic acid hydratase in catechol pathway
MQRWIRFDKAGETGFGTLDGDVIMVHEGDMFAGPEPTGQTVDLESVTVLTPTEPSKMIALWNNFHAMAEKNDLSIPEEPLYLIKTANSFLATGGIIVRPPAYAGKVVYEGEIGIVIGRTCSGVTEDEADGYIFGYTCINDVTAIDIIHKDPSFPQWSRAKSMDTFGVFGPVVAAGIDPQGLSIRTVLNGDERQNYPVSDMIHPPRRIVSSISHELTLNAGDVIACGTSLGLGSMKEPRNTIEVTIEGIGTLSNVFEQ